MTYKEQKINELFMEMTSELQPTCTHFYWKSKKSLFNIVRIFFTRLLLLYNFDESERRGAMCAEFVQYKMERKLKSKYSFLYNYGWKYFDLLEEILYEEMEKLGFILCAEQLFHEYETEHGLDYIDQNAELDNSREEKKAKKKYSYVYDMCDGKLSVHKVEMQGEEDNVAGVFEEVEEKEHDTTIIPQETSKPIISAASDNSALSDAVRYLSRPIQMESSVLTDQERVAVGYPDPTADTTNFKSVSIRDFALPQDLIAKSRAYREKLTGYSFFQADVKVKLEFTAAPTTSGRIGMVYIPFGTSALAGTVVDPSIRSTLNLTGLSGYEIRSEIDLGSKSTLAEMSIPFTTPLSAFTVDNAVGGQFGKLLVYAIQEVSEVIPFTVFMNFENIDLSIASGASQLATMQGEEESSPYVNIPAKGYTHVTTTGSEVSLSGNKTSQISGKPYFTNKDEMSFNDCTKTPMVVASAEWSEDQPSGTELFNFDVTANIAETKTFGNAPNQKTYHFPTYMFYILSIFNLYRFKTLYYHFDLAKTGLHSGKLRVLFTPRGTGANYNAVAEKSYQWIIDCKADRSSFTIPIPYIFVKPWLQPDEIIGQLSISVLNKIVRPSTVSSKIPILAKVSCEGLEGTYFSQRFLSVNTPFNSFPSTSLSKLAVMQGVENTVVEEPPMNMAPLNELTHVRCKGSANTCVGESFTHMMPCIKRYTIAATANLTEDNLVFPAPNSIKWFGVFRPDLLSHFGQLFRFHRGSMKYMVQCAKSGVSMYASLSRTLFDVNVTNVDIKDLEEDFVTPGHYVNSDKNNFLEFTVPFYSNVPYIPTYSSSDNIISTYSLFKLSNSPGVIRVYRSAGPDFTFGSRMSPPAMVASNKILPPLNAVDNADITLDLKDSRTILRDFVKKVKAAGTDVKTPTLERGDTHDISYPFPATFLGMKVKGDLNKSHQGVIGYKTTTPTGAIRVWVDPNTGAVKNERKVRTDILIYKQGSQLFRISISEDNFYTAENLIPGDYEFNELTGNRSFAFPLFNNGDITQTRAEMQSDDDDLVLMEARDEKFEQEIKEFIKQQEQAKKKFDETNAFMRRMKLKVPRTRRDGKALFEIYR